MRCLLCAIFCLSGAAALLFETLWFYQAGIAWWNSVWISSIVLAGFVGGLAIGNEFAGSLGSCAHKPVHLDAFLKRIIGLTGAWVMLLLPRAALILTPIFRTVFDRLDRAALTEHLDREAVTGLCFVENLRAPSQLRFAVADIFILQ